MSAVYFTICSANYIPYARVLAESIKSHQPDVHFVCILADEVTSGIDSGALGFDIVEAKSIGCSNFFDMAARYTIMEFNTAIKPFCFEWVLKEFKSRFAVYLDPDIILTGPLVELVEEFDRGAHIILTPHSLDPLFDGKDPDDIRLLRTGAYNLGFCAVKNSDQSKQFLRWWAQHLEKNCVVDLDGGLFVDQKFCDLVPCYFDGVSILRHPGYNVAYWNLHSRQVTQNAGGHWESNGFPLRFFHFSGVVPSDDSIFSKHQNRFTVDNIGDVKELLLYYIGRLRQLSSEGDLHYFKIPYKYSTLVGGINLTDFMRKVYSALQAPRARSYEEAFAENTGMYLTLSPDVEQSSGVPITRLMFEVWKGRKDLQHAFSLSSDKGRLGLLNWFLENATRDHGISRHIISATEELTLSDKTACNSPQFVSDDDSFAQVELTDRRFTAWAMPRRLNTTAVGVSVVGYFNAENGLGSAARSNVGAALSAGLDVEAIAVACPGFESKIDFPCVQTFTPKDGDCIILHINADQIHTVAQNIDPRGLRGRHRIGYWAWELPALPIEWISAFDHVDEIWVPSAFTAQAISSRTTKPVVTIPHPVTARLGSSRSISAIRAQWNIPLDKTVFLTAFDLNSYINRKNPFAVLEAFKIAFGNGDKNGPVLVVKLHGGSHRNKDYSRLFALIRSMNNIIVIDQVLSSIEIDDIQWACDVFVSLHRTEGFGLWIAECMAKGRPCIVTGYSGNMEFCGPDNSIIVGYSMIPVLRDEYPFGAGQWWADPDVSHAAEAMRSLNSNATLRHALGSRAQASITDRLAPEKIGQLMRNRLYRARSEMINLPTVSLVR